MTERFYAIFADWALGDIFRIGLRIRFGLALIAAFVAGFLMGWLA